MTIFTNICINRFTIVRLNCNEYNMKSTVNKSNEKEEIQITDLNDFAGLQIFPKK